MDHIAHLPVPLPIRTPSEARGVGSVTGTDTRPIDQMIAESTAAVTEGAHVQTTVRAPADQEAWDNHRALLERREQVEALYLEIGRLLRENQQRRYYERLGYETFDAYLASSNVNFRRTTAYKWMRVAELCDRLAIPASSVRVLGADKLDIIRRPLLDERQDPAEWIHTAAASGVRDLREAVTAALTRKGAPAPSQLTIEDDEAAADRKLAAELLAAFSHKVLRVEYGRWAGLTVAMEDGKAIRIWASGGALKVQIV